MPPLIGTTGAASAKGFGFTAASLGSSGWVAYLGPKFVAGSSASYTGFFVDALGNSYLPYFGSSTVVNVVKIDKNGTSAATAQPHSGQPTILIGGATRYTSAGRVPCTGGGTNLNSNNPVNMLDSSLSKLFSSPIYPTGTGDKYVYAYEQDAAVTSAGEVYISGKRSMGKSGSNYFISKYASNGSSLTFYYTPTYSRDSCVNILTNNRPVVIEKQGSTLYWHYYDTSLNYLAGYQASTGADGSATPSAYVDSSNNIYVCSLGGYIYRVTSSNTVSHMTYLSSASGVAGIAGYGSDLYILYAYNGPLYIACLSATDLSHKWTNRFTLSGTSGNISYANGRASIYANSEGVFAYWYVDETTIGTFLLKIPLTGMPSSSSKNLPTLGKTLAWTITTTSQTNYSPGSVSSANISNTAGSYTGATAYSAASASASPTLDKTVI